MDVVANMLSENVPEWRHRGPRKKLNLNYLPRTWVDIDIAFYQFLDQIY